jgi:hypothetical protein
MAQLAMITIPPSVDFSIGSESDGMTPSTCDLLKYNPIKSLDKSGLDLIDFVAVTKLTVLAATKGVHLSVLCDDCAVKSSTCNLLRTLPKKRFNETR